MRFGLDHPCETCGSNLAFFGLADAMKRIRWYCRACVPREFWKYARAKR